MSTIKPTILVIFGISGDLAARKLIPALSKIAASDHMPENFRLLGIGRKDLDAAKLLASLPADTDIQAAAKARLAESISVMKMDYESETDFDALQSRLTELEAELGGSAQRLFYLSVPPAASERIVERLGASGLASAPDTKLLLEKPFGVDLASAERFIHKTLEHFEETQIYRIDHYLAKEMAQNIIVFRRGNTLFRRTWNNEFIDRIEIIASEAIDIEGRANFYEQTGALRDLVQSHLLQLAALTLMDLPDNFESVRGLRLAALRYIAEASTGTIAATAIRGQYDGYRDEVNNTDSTTETFVSLQLASADPKWAGVPITLTTGKALDQKRTDINIYYHRDDNRECNVLTLSISPHEGISIGLWVKKPGYEKEFAHAPLDFVYEQYYKELPEAYEQVLLDAMRSEQMLFTFSKEVLASWEILAPVQAKWAASSDDLHFYAKGSTPATVAEPQD